MWRLSGGSGGSRKTFLFFAIALTCVGCVFGWNCTDGEEINDGWLCDHMTDCDDGSDEDPSNCEHRECESNQFRCNNTRCIHKSFVCNGESDCLDGDSSDEVDCENIEISGDCKDFQCADASGCVIKDWICDGERDCVDGSDEWGCPCLEGTYGCRVRGIALCLKNSTKCDRVSHCDRGYDEAGCDYSKNVDDSGFFCLQDRYKCRTVDECILWKLVCDGIDDCQDGSDEGGLCHVKDCASGGRMENYCSQRCHDTPDGVKCSCDRGYRLSKDKHGCIDIDECQEMLAAELHNTEKMSAIYDYGLAKVCSQNCENVDGGFACVCAEGYKLDADGYYCKAVGAFTPELCFAVGNEIRGISLRNPSGRSLYYDVVYKSYNEDERISDLDYYEDQQLLFWTEELSGLIKMKDYDDRELEVELDLRPRALAVDWAGANIFVTTWPDERMNDRRRDVRRASIKLISMKLLKAGPSSGRVKPPAVDVLTEGLVQPVAITLYPAKGLLVVADQGDPATDGSEIIVLDMDGENIRVLATSDYLVQDVVIDDVHDAVIWSSVGGDEQATVESIRLDGTQRGTIMSRKINNFPLDPVSIGLFESHLFVADKIAREIRTWQITDVSLYGPMNIMYGSKSAVKVSRSARLSAMKISHPVIQRPIKEADLCKNFGCSHSCVLVPDTVLLLKELLQPITLMARCLCPTKQRLGNDLRTCKDIVTEALPTALSDTPETSSTTAAATTQPLLKKLEKTAKAPICPGLVSVQHATTFPTDLSAFLHFQVGTLIRFTCSDGYSPDGTYRRRKDVTKIACLPEGKWNKLPPKCLPVKPSHPKAPSKKLVPKPSQKHTSSNDARKKVKARIEHENVFVKSMSDGKGTESEVLHVCDSNECGQWAACKSENGVYTCKCIYGSDETATEKCHPPPGNAEGVLAAEALVVGDHEGRRSIVERRLIGALIAMSVVLFLILSALACKCLRKRRYSVDLRYFRGKAKGKERNRPRILVTEVPTSLGKSASITNPNYTSPGQRRRLPKPDLKDDASFCTDDSGFHRSCGSGSLSSDSEVSDAASSGAKAPNNAPLLGDGVIDEDEVSMGEVVIEGAALSSSTRSTIGRKIGNIFKMRKTESRECMLPNRRKKSRKVFGSPS